MKTTTTIKNWVVGNTPEILENIHQNEVNIAIYNREINSLTNETNSLLKQDIEFRSSGDFDTVLHAVTNAFNPNEYHLIKKDIKKLLHLFREVTNAKKFRLLLATINTNMCKRFHTDINDLRMLCTYSGQGTLWLTEDNINRDALGSRKGNESIVIDESKIQQVKTNAVVLLKGAIYPIEGTNAAVHRSPTIEESGEKRLLLRIDTDEFLNF